MNYLNYFNILKSINRIFLTESGKSAAGDTCSGVVGTLRPVPPSSSCARSILLSSKLSWTTWATAELDEPKIVLVAEPVGVVKDGVEEAVVGAEESPKVKRP